jgi:SAM-dependent methyltransferase
MMIGALAPYETSLAGAGPLAMRTDDGEVIVLDVERYLAVSNAADATVIDRCRGPVLDIGCGPGRMVVALAARGIAALGLDIAPMAVELTRSRGVPVLLRDLFARIPGEGRWSSALLVDGNIGIGGDVDRVLVRLRVLLAADGRAVIETAADAATDRTMQVRFARAGVTTGPRFSWAVIGASALRERAVAAGFRVVDTWSVDGRHFVELARDGEPADAVAIAADNVADADGVDTNPAAADADADGACAAVARVA